MCLDMSKSSLIQCQVLIYHFVIGPSLLTNPSSKSHEVNGWAMTPMAQAAFLGRLHNATIQSWVISCRCPQSSYFPTIIWNDTNVSKVQTTPGSWDPLRLSKLHATKTYHVVHVNLGIKSELLKVRKALMSLNQRSASLDRSGWRECSCSSLKFPECQVLWASMGHRFCHFGHIRHVWNFWKLQ